MGDYLSMVIEFFVDHLSRGINFMGIVCPGGQDVGYRKSRENTVCNICLLLTTDFQDFFKKRSNVSQLTQNGKNVNTNNNIQQLNCTESFRKVKS